MLNRKTYLKRLCEKLLREADGTRENPFSEGDMALHQFTPDINYKERIAGTVYDCKKFFDMYMENAPAEGDIDDLTLTWIYQTSMEGIVQPMKKGGILHTSPDKKKKLPADLTDMKSNNEKLMKALKLPGDLFKQSADTATQNWFYEKGDWGYEEARPEPKEEEQYKEPSAEDFKPTGKASEEDIAFYSTPLGGGEMLGIVYDATNVSSRLKEVSRGGKNPKSVLPDVCQASILGMIMIKRPDPKKGKCNGAWEVKQSAGPGYGKLVYAMGYHMSGQEGSGWLMPDREGLSSPARGAWKGVRKKGGKSKPLDNINHKDPDFKSDAFHDEHHTDDPSDDCVTWPVGEAGSMAVNDGRDGGVEDAETQDAVNRAYALGDMGYDFKGLEARHADTLSLLDELNVPKDNFEKIITYLGREKFGSELQAGLERS